MLNPAVAHGRYEGGLRALRHGSSGRSVVRVRLTAVVKSPSYGPWQSWLVSREPWTRERMHLIFKGQCAGGPAHTSGYLEETNGAAT
jgi:hypothetical protein